MRNTWIFLDPVLFDMSKGMFNMKIQVQISTYQMWLLFFSALLVNENVTACVITYAYLSDFTMFPFLWFLNTAKKRVSVVAEIAFNVIVKLKRYRNINLKMFSLGGFSTGCDVAVLVCERAKIRFPNEKFGVLMGALTGILLNSILF